MQLLEENALDFIIHLIVYMKYAPEYKPTGQCIFISSFKIGI